MTTDSIIDRYNDCEVEIFYLTDSGQYRDKGRMTECDGTWILLERPGNETFLVPISSIRMIKILNPPKSPESLLLRPAEPDADRASRKLTSKP